MKDVYLNTKRDFYLNKNTIIVEYAPCKRVFHFKNGHVSLYLPYVYFVIHFTDASRRWGYDVFKFSNLRVFFREKRIENIDEESNVFCLGSKILSNFNSKSSESVCLGRNFGLTENSPEKIKNKVINAFWSSAFEMNIPVFWRFFTRIGFASLYLRFFMLISYKSNLKRFTNY